MANYYITYGWGTNQRNNYSTVQADSSAQARDIVSARIGDAWVFMYDDKSYQKAIANFNLEEIPLSPQQYIKE